MNIEAKRYDSEPEPVRVDQIWFLPDDFLTQVWHLSLFIVVEKTNAVKKFSKKYLTIKL